MSNKKYSSVIVFNTQEKCKYVITGLTVLYSAVLHPNLNADILTRKPSTDRSLLRLSFLLFARSVDVQ